MKRKKKQILSYLPFLVIPKTQKEPEKVHDYFMEQSKIAPMGLNDKEDKYYHSIFNYDK